jgi:hypothetical protein
MTVATSSPTSDTATDRDDRGTGQERRSPRVPFEALVEIAAPEGTSFEAESVDLSASGMHLRTAYLPKIGTPLTFRFDAGEAASGAPVMASGEVVWAHDGNEGCEFGVRFADVKPEGIEAIQRLIGGDDGASAGTSEDGPRKGAPVRIHIEGVQAPMRATLKDDLRKGAVVGSDLKMLKIGAFVELEDKEKRTRRTARVEGVDCEIDAHTQIPQLVVKLRYDAGALEGIKSGSPKTIAGMGPLTPPGVTMPPPAPAASASSTATAAASLDGDASRADTQARQALPVGDAGDNRMHALRENVGEGFKKVGHTMKDALSGMGAAASRLGARAKTTISLLSKRGAKDEGANDVEARRTTSPLPGIAKGRTLRPQGSLTDREEENAMEEIDPKKTARRKQIAIAAGVAVAFVLAFLAFRKPTQKNTVALAPAAELMPSAQPATAPLPAPTTPAIDPAAAPSGSALAAAPTTPTLQGEPTGSDPKGNPNPFGAKTVKNGTRMVLRLDGPIGELRGLALPNGFVVSVPNRKSLEAAGPLAAKDPRISSAKVVNQPNGAELTIAFKDAMPEYVVKAKNDSLEIVLARDKAVAKKGGKGKGAPAKATPKKK